MRVSPLPLTSVWGCCGQTSRFCSSVGEGAPLKAGARSTRRGLRVGVPDSLRRSFVWGAQLMDCPSRRTAPAPRTTVRGCCGLTLTVDHVAVTQLLFNGDGGLLVPTVTVQRWWAPRRPLIQGPRVAALGSLVLGRKIHWG